MSFQAGQQAGQFLPFFFWLCWFGGLGLQIYLRHDLGERVAAGLLLLTSAGFRFAEYRYARGTHLTAFAILLACAAQTVYMTNTQADSGRDAAAAVLACLALLAVGRLLFLTWAATYRPRVATDLGTARFATGPEALAAAGRQQGAPVRLGYVPVPRRFGRKVDWQPLTWPTNKHVLILAGTRGGKGTTLIIPHLLGHQGGAFVLDPKGENARPPTAGARSSGRSRCSIRSASRACPPSRGIRSPNFTARR
jgi:type IV secretory pathway TraG/TraD family ATPase VirD4